MVFEIYPRTKDTGNTADVRIGFRVASVDAAIAALTRAGAQVLSSPEESSWGRRGVAKDPDGHSAEMTQPQETEGA